MYRNCIVNLIFRLRQTENSILGPIISVCLRRKRKCLERSWAIFRLYLVMMLSYLITQPKPVLHSGSRLDRQWYSLRGYRPFMPPPLSYEITCIYNTILNFIWVSFCTAYIIFTFTARVRVMVRVRVC